MATPIRQYLLQGKPYSNRHLWKLRSRIAPSAKFTDMEICLYVYWNAESFPTKVQWKDPLLRPFGF